MLNVGPKPDGTIPEQAARSLRSAGEWIRRYPQVVYGTDASPWKHILPWGDVTTKGNKLFLSVYNWPTDGQLFLPGLKTDIVSVNILSGKVRKSVSFKKTGNWVQFNLLGLSPEKMISVIEVSLKGIPEVDTVQGIDPVTENFVPADFATVEGCVKNSRKWMEKFGEWKHVMQINKWTDQSKATWEVDVMQAGTYLVGLTYSGSGRMVWSVETDEGTKIKNQQNSSSIYMNFPIGWINFSKPGKHTISVSLLEGDFEKANLTGIKITPVEF
jgi:alpha-L-fucosidase